jgi:hypothetical protein
MEENFGYRVDQVVIRCNNDIKNLDSLGYCNLIIKV